MSEKEINEINDLIRKYDCTWEKFAEAKSNDKEQTIRKGKSDYITPSSLVSDHNWTKSMIVKLLGEPDKLSVNPRYRSAAPMRLYSLARVADAEKTPEYANLWQKAKKRKETGKKVGAMLSARAAANRQAIVEWFKALPVVIRWKGTVNGARKKGEKHALDLRIQRDLDRGDYSRMDYCGEPSLNTINRWAVNLIRHEWSNYDDLLDMLVERCTSQSCELECYEIVKAKVNAAILAKWPELA